MFLFLMGNVEVLTAHAAIGLWRSASNAVRGWLEYSSDAHIEVHTGVQTQSDTDSALIVKQAVFSYCHNLVFLVFLQQQDGKQKWGPGTTPSAWLMELYWSEGLVACSAALNHR